MRVINEQDVFDIIDDLRNRMTVEGYCAMVERIKALPSVQPNLQLTCNQLATDCISRQEAIRVASGYCHPANIAKELAKLPSAQPETHACDSISRQAAIEAIQGRKRG